LVRFDSLLIFTKMAGRHYCRVNQEMSFRPQGEI
jgi:hypothetical protein